MNLADVGILLLPQAQRDERIDVLSLSVSIVELQMIVMQDQIYHKPSSNLGLSTKWTL